ncbi:hypothetical protein BRE01_53990 [Brevibacillus reuszeri]|uniref:Xylose isomerase-like TIM barrel domain-containing protein n=1 Tax=Brevibacillus reuszeri TaxID=54915 RepID=A0A0K9YK91_9BACL|nr:sugar phosphate isomerase/epimerase [Brevibacillus reuszeri]KNB69178.1 hypothetical protein ADS79_24965 [Brevibacillus reuszeri]MED1860111.1 sugar phosphate isomerase/epimerase [Brevibacillus reuszeri]GED71697.1 hypothetical protein BRE01_53990 [Brevibacillus reuszeri]
MKFSVFTDMLGTESFEEALQLASGLGFSNVDVRAKLDGDTVDTISMEKAQAYKQMLDQYKLKVASVSSWAVNTCTFSGPPKYDNYDEAHHTAMYAVLERLFDLAHVWDAPFVRVYSLYRQENFLTLSEAEREAQYRHNAAIMRRHAEHAQERNKIIVVENEPPTLTSNAEELGKLAAYANHPHLKINWDIINGWRAQEYPTVEVYKHVMGHVWQTHLKGASRLSNSITEQNPHGNFGNFAIAGNDDYDHKPVIQAIAKFDPQVVMTIDTHYPSFYKQDQIGEVEAVRRTKAFFESLVEEVAAHD